MTQHIDFEARLQGIMTGKITIPNVVEVPPERGIAALAAGAGFVIQHGSYRTAERPWAGWARYFLNTTQGGQLDGTGYALLYNGGKGQIIRFTICEHAPVDDHGANRRRGWHPAHCSKCGLDLTVDSGD